MLSRREHSFFGDDSDDSVFDGGYDAIHDDVDESADASDLDVSDQGPVEPMHQVVPEDLQADIDFVETASRRELLGGGSEFNGLGDDGGGAFGSDGADDDLDDDNEATLADDEVQLFDDGIFEEDAVSGEAQQEGSSEAALASSAPISITTAPHQGLQLWVQAIHRRRNSCTPQAFCEARQPTYCGCLEGSVSLP